MDQENDNGYGHQLVNGEERDGDKHRDVFEPMNTHISAAAACSTSVNLLVLILQPGEDTAPV